MRWVVLASLVGFAVFAVWHWAGLFVREILNARTTASPCALPLEEVRFRMAYHGTWVAFCDNTGWKFPRGQKVCRLWTPEVRRSGGAEVQGSRGVGVRWRGI